MTRHFAQIVCLQRPEWFLFENVVGAADSTDYKYARGLWKRHGYGLTEIVLLASDYGVPQSRERFFCIGRLHEIDGFLNAEVEAAKSPHTAVVRDILDPSREDDAALLDAGSFTVNAWKDRKSVYSIDEPCPTITRSIHKPAAQKPPHRNDAGPIGAPRLTLSQLARIQGFPTRHDGRRDVFRYAHETWSKEAVAIMIADAVPAPLAQAIGKVIFDRHHGLQMPRLDNDFTDFLLSRPRKKPKSSTLSDRAIENVRHNTNRALRMCDGRIYAEIWRQIAHLESGHDKTGKAFSAMTKSVQSDLRNAVIAYCEYRADAKRFPPSDWAPTKPPARDLRLRGLAKPKPVRRKRKGSDLAPATPHPIAERVGNKVSWPPPYRPGSLDPELAALTDLFDPYEYANDPYSPQPPAMDPDEAWRPEGYDQDDYEVYVEYDETDETDETGD